MNITISGYDLPVDNNYKWLDDNIIYAVRHGSQAYGTALPTSDLDIKGICIAPSEYYYGFVHQSFKQITHTAPDYVFYEVRRFIELATNANPAALEMLFVDPSDHIFVHRYMRTLLSHRQIFISKHVVKAFSGYAIGQLHRIQIHREWTLNPPAKKPVRDDFGLPPLITITQDQLLAASHLDKQGLSYNSNFQDLVYREKLYRAAQTRWDQYQNWQRTRNPARYALEMKCGYDSKHAMHLVRLMRMCMEILSTGEVNVRRADARELLDIRAGLWSYDALIEWANRQQADIDTLAARSTLPDEAPLGKVNDICVELVFDLLDSGR